MEAAYPYRVTRSNTVSVTMRRPNLISCSFDPLRHNIAETGWNAGTNGLQ